MALAAGDIITYDGENWQNQKYVEGPFGVGGATSVGGVLLHVTHTDSQGKWARSGELLLQNTQPTNNTWVGIQHNSPGGQMASGIAFVNTDYFNAYGRIDFATRQASGFNGAVMSIYDAKVGIGTTSPGTLLDIVKSGNPDDVTEANMRLVNSVSSGENSYLSIQSGSNANAGITFGDNSDGDRGSIRYTNRTGDTGEWMSFFVAGERVRIKQDGSVGIGTASPSVTGLDNSLATALSGDIAATFSTRRDDYNPDDLSTATVLRIDPTGSTDDNRTITGLVGGADGRVLLICNRSTTLSLILAHDVTSTAANRFYCPGSTPLTIRVNGSCLVWYDSTASRWRCVAA